MLCYFRMDEKSEAGKAAIDDSDDSEAKEDKEAGAICQKVSKGQLMKVDIRRRSQSPNCRNEPCCKLRIDAL